MADDAPSTPLTLATPLREVRSLTPTLARDMASLGLTNVGRLIAHLPIRHEFHAAEAPIAALHPGQIVTARGEVTAARFVRGRKPRYEAVLIDETGRLDLVWFNMPFMRERVTIGSRLLVEGKLVRRGSVLQLANPRTQILDHAAPDADPRGEYLRPVYPASELVSSSRVEQAISRVLDDALPLIEDHLDDPTRAQRHLPPLAEAYRMQHRPANDDEIAASRRRLVYDEFLLLQLAVFMKRAHLRRALRAPALRLTPEIDRHIRARFPHTLTPAQDAVVAEVAKDLSATTPTNRLIQGDVGSGKTYVALYAMLMAAAHSKQSALLAPTEILAEQHFANISRLLSGSRVRAALLTGAASDAERDSLRAALARGEIDLAVGTHALLEEGVRFHDLAVIVIDEQHRFGVSQRAALRERHSGSSTPHVLVMTATPIPRTLAITLFGDLDISSIRALPPGRLPVRTVLAGAADRPRVYAEVAQHLARGEQAYIVAPAIDPTINPLTGPATSPATEGHASAPVRSVRSLAAELEASLLPGVRLAVLHAQLPRAQREEVFERFRLGEIQALIATTVIEVGLDVPNATVMLIEDADRFGLAQLHQLRGRVGRGSRPSVCYLVADPTTDEARQRLGVMHSTSDGFVLAEKDLELRGPGEVFGTRQSGLAPLRLADFTRDRDLLALARRDAAATIDRSPTLDDPSQALLRRRVLKAHGEFLGLGDVG